jgi:hypothetical protein
MKDRIAMDYRRIGPSLRTLGAVSGIYHPTPGSLISLVFFQVDRRQP